MKDAIKRIFDVLFYESELLSKAISPVRVKEKTDTTMEKETEDEKEKNNQINKKIIYLIYFLIILIFIVLTLLLF